MAYKFNPDVIVECRECGQGFSPEKWNFVKGEAVCTTCMDEDEGHYAADWYIIRPDAG